MPRKETDLPISKCPICDYELDAATCVEDKDSIPSPGDLTICIKCGDMLIFSEDLHVRLPTKEEYEKYGTDKRIVAAQIIIRGCAGKPDHLK